MRFDSETVVPFNDLGRGTQQLRPQLDAALARVLDSGWFVLGPEHEAFESELATYVGAGDAVAVGNGTDALQLALHALGVRPGDSVVTVANAGGYTTTAARSLGAELIYADVEPNQLVMSVETVQAAIEGLARPPRVVVVTHLFGALADVKGIVEFAHARDIAVVEDCAQSLGASIDGRRGGTFADIATTSFYPTKNLGALGDGGALFTSRPELAVTLRQLRQYGWESKYRTTIGGGRNSRLDELQAAILRVKLPGLDAANTRRREIHRAYEQAAGQGVRFVNESSESFVAHLAVIEVEDRQLAVQKFADSGVRTDIHYPVLDHMQPFQQESARWQLPVSERAVKRILSLPLFPELTDAEIDRICAAIGDLH